MAFSCDRLPNSKQVNVSNAYVVLGGYQELSKVDIVINVAVWRNKQDYLDLMPAMEHLRFVTSVTNLASTINFRTGIYTWLMQQPEFENPVVDLNDDFPVTPI